MAGPGGRRGGFERPKNARRTFMRVLDYMLRQKWLMLCVLLCIAVSAGAGVFGRSKPPRRPPGPAICPAIYSTPFCCEVYTSR